MDRAKYEKELKDRQANHLNDLSSGEDNWIPCMHDACTLCHGTGVGKFGPCVHAISCPCPKCTLS